MIAQLTTGERQLAIGLLLLLTVAGIAMAGAGQDDPLGIHGFLVIACSVGAIFYVISGY